MSTGIRKLRSKGCPGRDGGRCNCAGWEASVFSKRDRKETCFSEYLPAFA